MIVSHAPVHRRPPSLSQEESLSDKKTSADFVLPERGALGLYDPAYEHDACGVGFIARLDGKPIHELITDAVELLCNLEHRGAVGGDKATGDGSGMLLRVPDSFFRRETAALGFDLPERGDYAVGMIFLPADKTGGVTCRENLERFSVAEGCRVLGWRKVPVDDNQLGEYAMATKPDIWQLFLARDDVPVERFEQKLLVIRRQAEKAFGDWRDDDKNQFYVCSLSSKTIIYKGLLVGTGLLGFYHDLSDPEMASPYALVHQRYSTNTLPTWALAQPFRLLAHNGEINTLRGNVNQMHAREAEMSSPAFGEDIDKIKPALIQGASDSAITDNMVELLMLGGRSLPHAMMMIVPEAFGDRFIMSADKRAFYEYHSAIVEPWDGPAALMFCNDRYIGANLDRNGLRPARYTITKDGVVILSSETGALEVEPERIQSRGLLQPGKMFLVDFEQHRIIPDHEIKAKISRQHPYRQWLRENRIVLNGLFQATSAPRVPPDKLQRLHHAFLYTEEEMNMILAPMASKGQEAIGSMGNDASLAVFSDRPVLLFGYFKQLFAQVTNPPIDPLREDLVMSLMGWIGEERNILDETPAHCRRLKLNHPILTRQDLNLLRMSQASDFKVVDIGICFEFAGGSTAMEEALESLFVRAEQAVAEGARLLVLTDWGGDGKQAAIPVLLAVAGLHHHLIRCGLRNRVGLAVETGEAREVNHFSLLIGYGANAVCPYGAMATVAELATQNRLGPKEISPDTAVDNYITALKKGLLKTFSRMGISTLRSYCGAQIFEAVGLAPEFVAKYFTGTASRVGGVGLAEIATEALRRHESAYPTRGRPPKMLDIGGDIHNRNDGEHHLWSAEAVYKMQHAVRAGDYATFKEYTELIDDQSKQRTTLRSLFRFQPGEAVPIEEVEPVENIVTRFVSAAMSYGSISAEAHETIAIAMNRIGARSNSGEGGEDPARHTPFPNGDSANSRIKQIASGRFGVTTQYAISADELQIKISQGAKPGEGGQLPGHKVSEDIARVRHTTKGVTLISPPPHHDIYSIEDLAQLIYDLKAVNPEARVSVKLAAEVGVGTVAAGVAKAQADMVLIAGHDGGTGASPLTSIKNAGAPWELGLAETQHALVRNGLRSKIRVQVDGQLKTGRDVVVAALMGAEEFGFGTTVLVSVGCVMMRKCHVDTCPVGVATQRPELRKRFPGKPEHVVNFMRFIAEEVREHMAALGFRTIDEMVGRVDRLEMAPALDHWKTRGLDFTLLLTDPAPGGDKPISCPDCTKIKTKTPMDDALIREAGEAIKNKTPLRIEKPIRNIHRTVGARMSGYIVGMHGPAGLPPDTLRINFTGSAGQSFGAFLAPGVTLQVWGDVNDYLGKSMTGGRIVVTPHEKTTFSARENTIAGNVALYGATGGEIFIAGQAGMRFGVRNSGSTAVVEGVGDHGCEYMTGGTVVVLGHTGYNFAAGMSGGIAYVFDESELFDTRCNLDMVELETVWRAEDQAVLLDLIEQHFRYTKSSRAAAMLGDWEAHLPLFVKVIPLDFKMALERMQLASVQEDAVSASEEVFDA
jgi:glutamate synthase domain-containing protein 2/glutamate synthase domain-containing protein 1/glutamate synthase domain-containing protein 3